MAEKPTLSQTSRRSVAPASATERSFLPPLQAFKDLAQGERAATALENHLDSLEKKIEELLAKADEDEKKMKAQAKVPAEKSSKDETTGAA